MTAIVIIKREYISKLIFHCSYLCATLIQWDDLNFFRGLCLLLVISWSFYYGKIFYFESAIWYETIQTMIWNLRCYLKKLTILYAWIVLQVRMVIEFLWPLVLFLILMWVRTRGLKENKTACKELALNSDFKSVIFKYCTVSLFIVVSMQATMSPKFYRVSGVLNFSKTFSVLWATLVLRSMWKKRKMFGEAHSKCQEMKALICFNFDDQLLCGFLFRINKIVTAATPVLQGLVANNRTLATVNQVWRSVNVFAILAGGLQSKSEIKRLGKSSVRQQPLLGQICFSIYWRRSCGFSGPSKVKDFMTPEGKKGFVDTAEVYTGLSKSILEKALESEVYLDAINSVSVSMPFIPCIYWCPRGTFVMCYF